MTSRRVGNQPYTFERPDADNRKLFTVNMFSRLINYKIIVIFKFADFLFASEINIFAVELINTDN